MARLTYEVPFVPNTITAYAYKDPWFALGNLIGRAWANNYNERGINKLIDSMEGSIPGQQTDQGAVNSNLMNAALNSAGTDNQDSIAGLQKAIDSMKQGQPLPMSDYSGLGQAIGQSQTDPAVSATPAETSQNRIMKNWNAANPLPRVGTGEIQGPVYTVGENVPGMLEAGNIDLSNRPIVRNPDGTISTVRSIGVNLGGKEYLLPTVSDDGKILSTDEAVQQFRDTGKHLGVFDSPEASTNYAQSLHNQQAQAASQQSAQQGQLQPFDMQNWIAQMKAEGRRQGRPDYQIDLAIERMMPNAQAYLDSYNKQQADGIEAGMYQALDSGDWGELNKGWLQLQQYDPNRAKAWGNTIPSLKDLYSTGAERENTILSNSLEAQRENQKHLNRMAEADNVAQNARRNAEFNKYLQNKYGGASSGSSGGSSGSGSSSGGGSPNQYQLMGNNMLNAAANVFRGADRDQIAKTTSDIVGFLEAIDEDPEKKAKYNPSILNMLQEAAYTGNALREYLDGHYESANQYSSAVSNANSYFAQFLPSNRIKQ